MTFLNNVQYVCWIGALLLVGTAAPIRAAEPRIPVRERILDGLRFEHPRLRVTTADFDRLRALCESHDDTRLWLQRLRDKAEELMSVAPVQYQLAGPRKLLYDVSIHIKENMLLLGLLHQLTGARRYADRAWKDLETVANFPDWNPPHFLDTAEMTFALAIGYDWMSSAWTEAQRTAIRQAIEKLGLEQGLLCYREQRNWTRAVHNWNQVCNGGLSIGALAIADENPQLATEVLEITLNALPKAMDQFRPDGGCGEGPGYWGSAWDSSPIARSRQRRPWGRFWMRIWRAGMT